MDIETTNLARDHCPNCGSSIGAASTTATLGDHSSPHPGDLAVCAYCAAICTFDPALRMRLLTPQECAALPPGVLFRLQRTIRQIHIYAGRN